MSIKSFLASVRAYIVAFIIAPLVSFFDRSLDAVIADFTKLENRLDRFLDQQAEVRRGLIARRNALRAEIDGIWDRVGKIDDAVARAGRIKARVNEITK